MSWVFESLPAEFWADCISISNGSCSSKDSNLMTSWYWCQEPLSRRVEDWAWSGAWNLEARSCLVLSSRSWLWLPFVVTPLLTLTCGFLVSAVWPVSLEVAISLRFLDADSALLCPSIVFFSWHSWPARDFDLVISQCWDNLGRGLKWRKESWCLKFTAAVFPFCGHTTFNFGSWFSFKTIQFTFWDFHASFHRWCCFRSSCRFLSVLALAVNHPG